MCILVEDVDNYEIIFEGEADDFLFQKDNDSDLEEILYSLEHKKFGSTVLVTDDYGNEFMITKIDKLIY